jgi:hypothetical protein
MPPFPMTPFTVDAFLKLREELSELYARAWARLARRRRAAKVMDIEVSVELPASPPLPMPGNRSVRRAA